MKTRFKIGDEVFYKKNVNVTDTPEYIIRKGTIVTVRIKPEGVFPHYEVRTFGTDICFVLSEFDLYESQKEVVKSIK